MIMYSRNIKRELPCVDTITKADRTRSERVWTYIYLLTLENEWMFVTTLGYTPEYTFAKNMMAATPEDSPTIAMYGGVLFYKFDTNSLLSSQD